MQSPPSITEQEPIAAIGPAMPALNWQHQGFNWSRQGPLWTASLAGNSKSSFRGEMFSLDSIQFRFPGEPFIGKKAPAGAVHLIHRHGTRFLIIAVPLEIDDRSPRNLAISTLLRRFPLDPSEKLSWTGLQIDARLLLPNPMQAAVLFSGSLSHPPCTESVLWLLAQRSLSVPRAQLIELSTLLGEGVRPQQALNGRPVLGLHSTNP
jgi:carbonic anhydrase